MNLLRSNKFSCSTSTTYGSSAVVTMYKNTKNKNEIKIPKDGTKLENRDQKKIPCQFGKNTFPLMILTMHYNASVSYPSRDSIPCFGKNLIEIQRQEEVASVACCGPQGRNYTFIKEIFALPFSMKLFTFGTLSWKYNTISA